MKITLVSGKTLPPKIWLWFAILPFPRLSNSLNLRGLLSNAKEKSALMTSICSLLLLT